MAAAIQELQQQLLQSHEQLRLLSGELNSTKNDLAAAVQQVAAAMPQIAFLNQDRLEKDRRMTEMHSALMGLIASGNAGGGGGRESTVTLVNLKTMAPKVFDGKVESHFRNWAKKVRAYCNGSKPGFKNFLQWIEPGIAI